MKFIETEIKDCYIVECDRFKDDRGYFQELYQNIKYLNLEFKEVQQTNWSCSKKNVLRGIHLAGYAKLVTCITGKIWDVVIDLRKESETYKKYIGVELSGISNKQVFVPAGCGHGFVSLEENSHVVYLQDGKFSDGEKTIFYQDKDMNINWLGENHIVSDRDKNADLLSVVLG